MSKNSTLPLILLGLVLVSLPLFIHDRDNQGYNGPSLYVGIYRGQEGRVIHSIESEAIAIENTVEWSDTVLGKASIRNYQQGLEGPTWNNVLIFAEDDHPMTKSVVKGLAELMTGMLGKDQYGFAMPFYLVHVQPHKEPVRPWGASRIIRIATQEADLHPQAVADSFSAKVSFCIQDPRLPEQTRAFIPLAAGGVEEMGFFIKHHSQATGVKSEHMNWASWHATLGRSIASDAMRQCFGGETEELDWQGLDYDTELGAWREWKPLEEGKEQTFGDKQLLPASPDHKVLTLFCGFQEPLARGWCGSIIGLSVQSRMGSTQVTVDKWESHITGSGTWLKAPSLAENTLFWKSTKSDHNHLDFILTLTQDYGADVVSWMADPRLQAVYKEWLEKAAAGDYAARVLLRRYLLCEHIDAAKRAEALTLLRQNKQLADLAIIGLHPDASPEEKQIASAVAYVRGTIDNSVAIELLPLLTTTNVDWNGEPILVKTDVALYVFVRQLNVKAGKEPRTQLWWREFKEGSVAKRADFKQGQVQADGVQIQIVESEAGLRVDFK